MHPCLLLPEIVHRISDELDSKSTFPFALGCRAFLEPGLDRLWSDLDSFDPIIACLPEDLFKFTEVLYDSRVYNHYSFCRELLDSDLRRYLSYYAPRIRSFDMNITFNNGMQVLSLDAFNAIKHVTRSQHGVLSPNLTRFRWFVHNRSGVWRADTGLSQQMSLYISLFLGKNVTDLGFDLDGGDFEVHRTAVGEALERFGPNLETLQISGIDSEFLDHPGRLCPWDRLRDLHLSRPHVGVIPHLALLPCLSSLLVMDGVTGQHDEEDSEPVSDDEDSALVGTNGFLSLETLHIVSYDYSEVRYFVQHLAPRNRLKKIVWEHAGEADKEEVIAFVEAVQRYCDPLSLSHVAMLDCGITGWEEIVDDHGIPSLSSLFVFKKLQHIEMSTIPGIKITPEIIASIPQNWPDLRRLSVCPAVWRYRPHEVDHTHIMEQSWNSPRTFLTSKFWAYHSIAPESLAVNGSSNHIPDCTHSMPAIRPLLPPLSWWHSSNIISLV
ncbi:hypothetical protein NMY22_g9290 [Coprinellus aureogranulatus]|nr:hypothetical protein NMY22_g9290 [Coprinellus aureogranulatus]